MIEKVERVEQIEDVEEIKNVERKSRVYRRENISYANEIARELLEYNANPLQLIFNSCLFHDDLVKNALFLNWANKYLKKNYTCLRPLKDFYRSYENYVLRLQQTPVSRKNHLIGLKCVFNLPQIKRKSDGYYIKGIKLLITEYYN